MAGLDCFVNSGTRSLAANVEGTVLQIKSAANHRVKIKGYSITMGGIIVKDLIVKVLNQDSGTAETTLSPVKWTTGASEIIQTSAFTNFSTQPSGGTILQYKRLQSSYEKIFPLGQELIMEGDSYLGIAVTSVGDTASLAAEIFFEE